MSRRSRRLLPASEIEALEQQLDAAYESFQQKHKHERKLAEAVDGATEPRGHPPIYYKVVIAVLLLLLLVITGLWLGVIQPWLKTPKFTIG